MTEFLITVRGSCYTPSSLPRPVRCSLSKYFTVKLNYRRNQLGINIYHRYVRTALESLLTKMRGIFKV